MKLKIIIFLLLSTFLYLNLSNPVLAAKKRVRKPKIAIKSSVSKGVKTSVRLRPDHLGLLMNFSSFDNLKSGRYELIYTGNGIQQGAGGSIILGDSDTKEILFASCSKNVCTWHENIQNMRLSIVSSLKDGTTVLKPYRIKV